MVYTLYIILLGHYSRPALLHYLILGVTVDGDERRQMRIEPKSTDCNFGQSLYVLVPLESEKLALSDSEVYQVTYRRPILLTLTWKGFFHIHGSMALHAFSVAIHYCVHGLSVFGKLNSCACARVYQVLLVDYETK